MNCKSHYSQPLTGVSLRHQQLQLPWGNSKWELATIIEYFNYTKIMIGIIILIVSLINYDQMMLFFDVNELWLEKSRKNALSLNLTLF